MSLTYIQRSRLNALAIGPKFYSFGDSVNLSLRRLGLIQQTGERDFAGLRSRWRITDAGRAALKVREPAR